MCNGGVFHERSAPFSKRISLSRNPPDTVGFAASFAPFTGFGNGKSPLSQAKSDQDLPLKRSTAEARPICLQKAYFSPDFPTPLTPAPVMLARAVPAVGRSAIGFRRTSVSAPRPRRAGT